MAEPVIMPKLAMAMQEGSVVEWLAEEGAWVEKGQAVMVVETEKVTYECEAPAAGFLHPRVELGVTVPVFEPVAFLAADRDELAAVQAEQESRGEAPAQAVAGQPEEPPAEGKVRVVASPVAKKLARQHNLDLGSLEGSGPGGRIIKEDVERALARLEEARRATSGPAPGALAPLAESLEVDGRKVLVTLPLAGMRKAIAQHMHRSLSTAAQLSFMGEVDATELIRLQDSLLSKEDEIGARVSFTDLFVLIIAQSVEHAPAVNASLVGDEIHVWASVNVGVAVALEGGPYESGLIVPVIRDAKHKSLAEIARTRQDLVSRARQNRLTVDDVTGGTITLSNVGMLCKGWMVSTPILNQPETIIVQPGGIVERPVVVDGQVVVRPVMTLSVTFDHRVVDGVPVIHFYNRMAELIENPAYLLL